MKTYTTVVILYFSFFFYSNCFAGQSLSEEPLVFSIDAKNISLQEALKDFSKKTKWKVIIESKLANTKISGIYSNTSIESFIKKSLKEQNTIVIFDEKQKTIEIRSFGKKGVQQVMIAEGEVSKFPLVFDQQVIADVHSKQEKAISEYVNNPASIEPFTGKTFGEIAELHSKQEKAISEYVNNPASIEPFTGKTFGEIAELHSKQEKAISEYVNNPASIEPFTGKTFGEIAELHSKQEKAISEYVNNPASIEPFTGKTFGEIADSKVEK